MFLIKLTLSWKLHTSLKQDIIVHFQWTKAMCAFNKYTDKVFIPYVNKQLPHSTGVDIMWDTYVPYFEGVYKLKER